MFDEEFGYISDNVVSYRLSAIRKLGGKCSRCGFSDIRALQVDHVEGGGTQELKSIGAYTVFKSIIENPQAARSKYQILCANCNWIKKTERKEYRGKARSQREYRDTQFLINGTELTPPCSDKAVRGFAR